MSLETGKRAYFPTRIETGEQLIAWRKALHLSQIELARILDLNRNTVSFWERDIKRPPKWLYTWFLGYKYRTRKWGSTASEQLSDKRKKIIHDYLNGEKVAVISAKFGVGKQYAGALAKRLGLPTRPPHRVSRINKGVIHVQ